MITLYEGNEIWTCHFDSGREIILSEDEINELVQHENQKLKELVQQLKEEINALTQQLKDAEE